MIEGAPTDFDRHAWKDARWSRWSFRNTARFLPVAPLVAAQNPRVLALGPMRIPDGWEPFVAATHATSALVLAEGKVVADWGNAASDPSPHMLFSITKSLVGMTARLLIEDGAVDPESAAAYYLPDLEGTAFGGAALAQLLAMTDGVPFDETYAAPHADIHRYSRGYWGDAAGGARAQLAALRPRAAVEGFAYRTPVADVVGAILATATGVALPALVGELLWRPMGAAHPAHFLLDTAGVPIAGAGLNAATSDLARLALLLLDGGAWNGRQVVPERVVEDLFAGGDRAAFARGYAGRPGWSYRDLWWNMGEGRLAALGVHGQRLIIDRKHGFVLVRTGAQPEPDNRRYDALHDAMLASLTTRTHSDLEPDMEGLSR